MALFREILRVQDPGSEVVAVKFFTAPALARFATPGAASGQAQSAYHRALAQRYPDLFSITCGNHSFDRGGTLLPTFLDARQFDRKLRSRVWKIEEKQTDVKLALTLYRDAAKGLYQHLLLCSNDSDAEPALKALKEGCPEIRLGVVTPVRSPQAGEVHRRVGGSLAAHADWTRRHLLDEELAGARLPALVPARKKPIRKPPPW